MIAMLTGTVAAVEADAVVLDVHGVGYHVMLPAQSVQQLPSIGQPLTVHIHTHVREDQIALFGFRTPGERTLFQRLLSVSGVGPKLALAILSGLAPHDLVQAVVGEDAKQLCAIPGIGRKTAERIVIDLRDRLLKDHAAILPVQGTTAVAPRINQDALSALLNLGYARAAAEGALRTVQDRNMALPLGTMIKDALKELAAR